MQQMNDQEFLAYLKKYKPYLYDYEAQVIAIRNDRGFGDISVASSMTYGEVDRGEILATSKKIYIRRTSNKLTK